MKRSIIIVTAVLGFLIVGLAAYLVPFYTVDPNFSVTVQKDERSDYRFEIDPNFVVNSIYSVRITDSNGLLAKQDEPKAGIQYLTVPGDVPSGTTVTVHCSLQYDRIIPSIADRKKDLVLP